MTKHLIINTSVVTEDAVLPGYCIGIENGKIQAVFPNDALQEIEKDVEVFDANGAYSTPGLIDMHIHGYAGFGPENETETDLLEMSARLAPSGVTAFCPTLYCGKPDEMKKRIEKTVGAFGKETGAHLIGYHLEGPFISPEKPGVMKPEDISPINLPVLQELYEAARGHIASMTVAPELKGIEELVKFCNEKKILLQAGHTNATYEEFFKGIALGITHATHLFNAMSPFNHRAPGAAGAILIRENVSTEIIADGAHVHPALIAFLRRVKPIENIVLVTDSLKPTAQERGPFYANGQEVVFINGVWKRVKDGVIAGSGLTMLQAVKNLIHFNYSLPEAVLAATANPARLLHLKRKGKLLPGFDADIAVFTKQFKPLRTYINGK